MTEVLTLRLSMYLLHLLIVLTPLERLFAENLFKLANWMNIAQLQIIFKRKIKSLPKSNL
jgi:hypothetical protein